MTVFKLINYSNPNLEGQPSAPILTSQRKEQRRKVLKRRNDTKVLYLPREAVQNCMALIAFGVCVSQEKTKELAQKQAQQ